MKLLKAKHLYLKLGLICFALALGLTGYNMYDDMRAGAHAAKILEAFNVKEKFDKISGIDLSHLNMPTRTIDGDEYIGVLRMPTIGKELPVLSECTYPNLRKAPCRFYGTTYARNLVIGGHNYTRHMGPIRRLGIGDEVSFIDVEGYVTIYEVSEKIILKPDQVVDLTESEGWDLSLFTCTLGGTSRTVVRCIQVQ